MLSTSFNEVTWRVGRVTFSQQLDFGGGLDHNVDPEIILWNFYQCRIVEILRILCNQLPWQRCVLSKCF